MALLEGPVHLIQEESTISMATQLHILVDVSYNLLMNYCLSTYARGILWTTFTVLEAFQILY